jgi:signal transduction histidine kinase
VERFKPQAEVHRVKIDLVLEKGGKSPQGEMIQVDPGRIEQVLGNLLSNALRYTPEGGDIELRYSSNEENVTLTVHDSGPGIPPEAIPHIFERFYRADRSRSRTEGGTGLGLAIARQLVQAHGGSLTAGNHPAGGAAFTLTLPSGGKA